MVFPVHAGVCCTPGTILLGGSQPALRGRWGEHEGGLQPHAAPLLLLGRDGRRDHPWPSSHTAKAGWGAPGRRLQAVWLAGGCPFLIKHRAASWLPGWNAARFPSPPHGDAPPAACVQMTPRGQRCPRGHREFWPRSSVVSPWGFVSRPRERQRAAQRVEGKGRLRQTLTPGEPGWLPQHGVALVAVGREGAESTGSILGAAARCGVALQRVTAR